MGRRDEAEFARLVEPLLGRAAAYAHALLHNRQDAEDAVQEAALKAFRRLDHYDRSRPFKGWWFAILRNCCRDLLRRRRARPASVPVDPAELPAEASPPPDDALGRALEQLSPAHREILELRYFGECSYRDLATALAIPEGTVMSRLHAARQALAAVYRREAE